MRGRPSALLDTKDGRCDEASDLLLVWVLDLDVDNVLALGDDNGKKKHCIVSYNIHNDRSRSNCSTAQHMQSAGRGLTGGISLGSSTSWLRN